MSDKYEVCIHVCVLSVYISMLLICMFFHVNIEHLCIQKAWLLNSLCVQETSLNTPSLSTSYYSSSFSLDSSSLPSISSHLVAKRTVFLPKEPQFIANAKTSEHTHQDEPILNQIRLGGSITSCVTLVWRRVFNLYLRATRAGWCQKTLSAFHRNWAQLLSMLSKIPHLDLLNH